MLTTFDRRISTQLKTWLTAVGIPFEDNTAGLIVTNKEGKRIHLCVASGNADVTGCELVVNGPDLTNRNLKKSLETFAALQTSLGYEPKLPVDRGQIPTHKAHYGKDFELVAMRHSEFRRAPNPPATKMAEYEDVISKAVWKFYRKNTQTCMDHVMGVDDLRTYAQIWSCNYIALYEVKDAPLIDRERFLAQYLGQRFYEFRHQLDKKGRNTLPMLDDAFIATHGRPYDYSNKDGWFTSEEEDPVDLLGAVPEQEEEGVVRLKERTFADRERGRKESATFLDEHLAEMDHDAMVEILASAVENDRIHDDARREASKRLRAHAMSCKKCEGRELPKAHGDDSVPSNVEIADELGNVYASVKEAAKTLGVYPSNVRAVLSGRYRHTGGHKFTYVQPSVAAEVDEEAPGPVEASDNLK